MSAELEYGMGSSLGDALFESLPFPIVVLGQDFILEAANSAWHVLTGNPPQQQIRLNTQESATFMQACLQAGLFTRDESPAIETGLILVSQGKLSRYSTNLTPASGVPLLLIATKLQGQAGRLLITFMEYSVAIHAAASVACIRGLVDSSRDAIVGLSPDGRILTWSGSSREVFGYTAEEMRGKDISCIAPPDRHPESHEILNRLQKGERIDRLQTVRLRKDGQPIDILLSGFPLWDASGGIAGLTLVIRPEESVEDCREHSMDVTREISDLARVTGQPVAAVTALSFGLTPLQESNPDMFNEVVGRYTQVLERALKEKGFKVENKTSEALRSIAESLGRLRAGPRDTMDIHVAALKKLTVNRQPSVTQVYLSEGRLKVIELLGDLVAFYRNYAVIR